MTINQLKGFNLALKNSGVEFKGKLKNIQKLKSGNYIIKDMWCGFMMCFYHVNVKSNVIRQGNVIKGKAVLYTDFKPIEFNINNF